jgi:SAM-dependent methyltransferase
MFVNNGWLKPGMKVLDYGAGLGRFSIPFSRIATVKALDVNPDMVEYMRSKGVQAEIASDLTPVLGDRFDFALSAYVLQHNDIIDVQRLTKQLSIVADIFYFTYPVTDLEHNRNLTLYGYYKEMQKLPLLCNTQTSRTMTRDELPVLFSQSLFNSSTITSVGSPRDNLYRITK